jgi:hypothetical protein
MAPIVKLRLTGIWLLSEKLALVAFREQMAGDLTVFPETLSLDTSVPQRSITNAQRGWNRQPEGGSGRLGTSPEMTAARTNPGSRRGTAN